MVSSTTSGRCCRRRLRRRRQGMLPVALSSLSSAEAFIVHPFLHAQTDTCCRSGSGIGSSPGATAVAGKTLLWARGGRRVKPPDDHDEIMNYLARSEARSGGGLGFGYPNHPPDNRHHSNRQSKDHTGSKTKKNVEYNWCSIDQLDKDQVKTMLSERTMSTAVCIVPSDEHWDALQRARFLVRDTTYQQWPPAIRLFHPFAPRNQLPNAATAIANVIEEYDIEPFDITLDHLLILPHFEVLDEQTDAESEMVRKHVEEEKEARINAEEEARREIREQIDEESRRSLERKLKRKPRGGEKKKAPVEPNNDPVESSVDSGGGSVSKPSPQETLDQQRASQSEFNGPCVVCLEPNEECRERLEEIREILRVELFGAYDPFSASSGVSSSGVLPRMVDKEHKRLSKGFAAASGNGGVSFRPVVALARFPSVTAAVEAAKKIQEQWEPLTFSVTDLSIISRTDGGGPVDSSGFGSNGSNVSIRRLQGTEFETESALLSAKGRYGCDALISLVGAEPLGQGQVEGEQEILDLLLEAGEPGGAETRLDYEALLELADEEEDSRRRQSRIRLDPMYYEEDEAVKKGEESEQEEDWEHWLVDDDEWDEGATIVIGRTQFFMGEARQYVGMPAMSATDGKDRVLGEGINGVVRRKSVVSRKGARWNDGDYGRKEKDYR